jgi:multiple sugar transport system substrate-binding protein/raffinose/stachyose/melibiose transport system substrate-binding protein
MVKYDKRRKVAVAASLLAASALTLGGCATPSTETGPASITFMPIVSDNLNEELWAGIIEDFEAANPNVTVELISPAGNEYTTYGKQLFSSGNFPDVVVSQQADFAQLGAIAPLEDEFVTPFRNYEDTAIDGEYFYVPTAVQPLSLVWYNADLLSEAGVSEPPATPEALTEALEALAGVSPTPLSINGEWTTGFQYAWSTTPTVMGNDPTWFANRTAGETTFADSYWAQNAELFAEWNTAGYFGEGALSKTFDQGGQEFIAGGSALYPMGVWFGATLAASPPDFEVGVMPWPTEDGTPTLSAGLSLGYSVSADSEYPEAAREFLRFITQDEGAVSAQLAADGLFSNAVEPVTYDLEGPLQAVADLVASVDVELGSINGIGNSVSPPGFTDYLNTQAQSLVLGDLTAEEFIASLDQWWDSNI